MKRTITYLYNGFHVFQEITGKEVIYTASLDDSGRAMIFQTMTDAVNWGKVNL